MQKNVKKIALVLILAAVIIPRDAHAIKPLPLAVGVASGISALCCTGVGFFGRVAFDAILNEKEFYEGVAELAMDNPNTLKVGRCIEMLLYVAKEGLDRNFLDIAKGLVVAGALLSWASYRKIKQAFAE